MVEGQEEEEEEGGRGRAEGRPPPRSPHAVSSVTSRLGSEGGSVKEREGGMRSFLKENQELEYIFAPPDSHEKPQKLAKSI